MSTFGLKLSLTLFGESHGKAIGCVLANIPAGIKLDLDAIQLELNRRLPGQFLTTPRKEADRFEIVSGLKDNITLGSPITMMIFNNDTRSDDYQLEVFRPNHSDFTLYHKYQGNHNLSGSGHFSGRLTAPLVFAGAICKQILAKDNILIASHLKQIGDLYDEDFSDETLCEDKFKTLNQSSLPLLNAELNTPIIDLVNQCIKSHDSIGAKIQVAAINLPIGLGEPFFNKLDSQLAHLFFAVGGVKAVEFGAGVSAASQRGSNYNDLFYVDQKVKTTTNNSGGIQAGLSNGMPILCDITFKPTSSIGLPQKTVDIHNQEQLLTIQGRHDACIALRSFVILESILAFVICDFLLLEKGNTHGTY